MVNSLGDAGPAEADDEEVSFETRGARKDGDAGEGWCGGGRNASSGD